MRIKINFTPATSLMPIQNHDILNSYIHKCLGNNNPYHDISGPYNISSIQGGVQTEDKNLLDFSNGGYICVSSMDMQFLDSLIGGISNNPHFTNGMIFTGTEFIHERLIDGWNKFFTLSPFLFKNNKLTWKERCRTFKNQENFDEYVKLRISNKLLKINPSIDLSEFKIQIKIYEGDKVKNILVHNVINHANQCQISIHGNLETIKLIYHLGIGQSTNSGFGTIAKVENIPFYRPKRKIEFKKSKVLEESII